MSIEPVPKVSHHFLPNLIGKVGLRNAQNSDDDRDPRHHSSKDPQQAQVGAATTGEEARVEYDPDKDRIDYPKSGGNNDK